MKVSVIASSQAKIWMADSVHRDVGFCTNLSPLIFSRKSNLYFGQTIGWSTKSPIRLILKAVAQSEPLVSDKVSCNTMTSRTGSKAVNELLNDWSALTGQQHPPVSDWREANPFFHYSCLVAEKAKGKKRKFWAFVLHFALFLAA